MLLIYIHYQQTNTHKESSGYLTNLLYKSSSDGFVSKDIYGIYKYTVTLHSIQVIWRFTTDEWAEVIYSFLLIGQLLY